MPEFRTIQFTTACKVIERARSEYGKPWTCTFWDCKAVSDYLFGLHDKSVLGNWEHAASLIDQIYEQIKKED